MTSGAAGPLLAALLAAGLATACAGARRIVTGLPRVVTGEPRISQEDLREALADYAARYAAGVGGAADEIHRRTRELTLRRRALLWKIRVIPLMQEAAFSGDAREGYVAVLTLAVLVHRYLADGDGRDAFGALQPVAVSAARELEDDAQRLGAAFLAPGDLDRAIREVAEVASRRPIRGTEFDARAARLAIAEVHTGGAFAWVVDLPMAPFRALEGVSSGAQAIHEFNRTAAAFARIVDGIPEQLRWQSELLLYDVEERETLVQSLAAFESLAESAARASAAVEALPAELRTTLADSEGALVRAREVLASAEVLVAPLNETAQHVRDAGTAWAGIVRRDGEPPGEGRPFDVTEWERAAREVGAASARLAELTAQLRGLVESQQLDAALGHVSASVDLAESSARGVVDAAAWRGLQLLVACFVLVLAYRLLSPLLPRSRR